MKEERNKKPWLALVGKLKHLRHETARINRLIEEESEKIDAEIWEFAPVEPLRPRRQKPYFTG